MTNANDYRAPCPRCKATGRVGKTFAHGVCARCEGRGTLPSLNDKIANMQKRLDACAAAGKHMVAKGFKADVIEATRDQYRNLRRELRALEARR